MPSDMAADGVSDRERRIARLMRDFLEAMGYEAIGELAETPRRVAELWTRQLLQPAANVGVLLRSDASLQDPRDVSAPVAVVDIGVHLVCPHHLTIAFGRAHVAYVPGTHVLGFGTLGQLAEQMTARLVLQERATQDIADALVAHAGAKAAIACIQATHPCHNITRPRSHDAAAITWAVAGDAAQHEALRQTTMMALERPR